MKARNVRQYLHPRKLSREESIHLICVATFYLAWSAVTLSTLVFLAYINVSLLGLIIFTLLAIGSFPSLLYLLDKRKCKGR